MHKRIAKKVSSINWDFKSHDTQYMTHGIHKYPARMIPQIAKNLITIFSKKGDLIADPFSGSGTVVVEAILNNRKAIGNDLNPLAILLSEVRANPISQKKLDKSYELLKQALDNKQKTKNYKITKKHFDDISKDTNLEYWFKNNVLNELIKIKSIIDSAKLEADIKKFFNVCFAATVRQVSYLRPGEYKIYRIPKHKIDKHNPDTVKEFIKITDKYIKLMAEYNSFLTKNKLKAKYKITSGDARNLPKNVFKNSSVDLVVTSPPYGDSRTTVAYGQFSRYPLILLGHGKKEIYDIDKNLLGGQSVSILSELKSDTLKKILEEIEKRDPARANDTLWFMTDLYLTIKEMGRILKKGGYACIVIGNRAVRRIRVPTSKIIEEMAVHAPKGHNFSHTVTFGRNIPTKNNPISSKFKLADGSIEWIKTMSTEDIIILKKN